MARQLQGISPLLLENAHIVELALVAGTTTIVLMSPLTPNKSYFRDGFGGVGAGLGKDGDFDMGSVQHDTNHDESREVHDIYTTNKAPPDVPASKGGNASTIASDVGVSPSKRGRDLEDATQGPDDKRVKKAIACPAKPSTKGPLEHIHSKLVTSDNPEIHMSRVDKVVVVSPTVAASSDACTATMMTQPDVDGWKVVKFAELVLQGTPEKISSSLHEYYRRIDEDAIKRRLLRNQGQPSFGSLDVLVYDDVYSSLTHGSVRHASLVRPPSADDFQPEFRAARERSILYDVVRHFENVTSNTKHMKELRD
ncbi:hypothetical protein D1007_60161 [Hordeum vulgare]|nr:hypothetical protein D1007_60161 [Hordeum vulgare]